MRTERKYCKPSRIRFLSECVWLCISALLATSICKADTIDYWHVYHNKTKLKEFNTFTAGGTIVFKISDIRDGDSITVRYFRDTPCTDCITTLTAEDGKQYTVTTGQGKGTCRPVSVSLTDILKYKEKNGQGNFIVYYHEDNRIPNRTLLFRIQLE